MSNTQTPRKPRTPEEIFGEIDSLKSKIKELRQKCIDLYENAREMGFRRPRTSDQHAKNREAIAAKVAAKAKAAGREPGRRGRPPRKCNGCGLAVPKGKGGKCVACGTGAKYPSKKKQKKTCAE